MSDFDVPMEVSQLELAFPADVRHLMPAYDSIPEEYRMGSGDHFVRVAEAWFSRGLHATVSFHLYEDIDGDKMIRHLSCILGSFQPKHEHKIAAVAYLLSKWCGKVVGWEKVPDPT